MNEKRNIGTSSRFSAEHFICPWRILVLTHHFWYFLFALSCVSPLHGSPLGIMCHICNDIAFVWQITPVFFAPRQIEIWTLACLGRFSVYNIEIKPVPKPSLRRPLKLPERCTWARNTPLTWSLLAFDLTELKSLPCKMKKYRKKSRWK